MKLHPLLKKLQMCNGNTMTKLSLSLENHTISNIHTQKTTVLLDEDS